MTTAVMEGATTREEAAGRYRAAVNEVAGSSRPDVLPPADVLVLAGRTAEQFRRDVLTLQQRRRNARTLAGARERFAEADRLEAAYREKAAEFDRVEREGLAAIEAKRRELLGGGEFDRAARLRRDVRRELNEARQELLRTADPAIDAGLAEIHLEIAEVERETLRQRAIVDGRAEPGRPAADGPRRDEDHWRGVLTQAEFDLTQTRGDEAKAERLTARKAEAERMLRAIETAREELRSLAERRQELGDAVAAAERRKLDPERFAIA